MSRSASAASKILDSYIKDCIAPVLLDAGFNATGRVFRRTAGGALQVVDIQNWKFNDSERARFTLEVGVCYPRLLAAAAELEAYAFYRLNLTKPGITECAARRRLGFFLDPPRDTWWTVSATTHHVPPAEQITLPLEAAALPWMETQAVMSSFVSTAKEEHSLSSPVMEVAALFAMGEVGAASAAAGLLAKARHPTQPELEKAFLADLLTLRRLESPAGRDA